MSISESTLRLALKSAGLRLSRDLEARARQSRLNEELAWEMAVNTVKQRLEMSYRIEPRSNGHEGPPRMGITSRDSLSDGEP